MVVDEETGEIQATADMVEELGGVTEYFEMQALKEETGKLEAQITNMIDEPGVKTTDQKNDQDEVTTVVQPEQQERAPTTESKPTSDKPESAVPE